MTAPRLEANGLVLRPLNEADAEAITVCASTPGFFRGRFRLHNFFGRPATGAAVRPQAPRPPPPQFVRKLDHLIDFVDTASIGLHWVGPDGTILWANPADYEPLGYQPDEYIGHNIAEFHADQAAIEDILEKLKSGQRIQNYEARLKCKDGSVRHVEITSSVLFEGTGEDRRFVHTRCYTQDITERKKMEEARDRFVAVLGHDLRNPLTSILMAAQRLSQAPELGSEHQKTVQRLSTTAKRMSRMVTDLVDYARTMGSGITLEPRPVDLAKIGGSIVEEARMANPGAKIDLATEGDTTGSWDPDRVSQALSNLVGNALQHGEPPVRVSVKGEQDKVIVAVANQGGPIPSQDLPDLFEPFNGKSAGGLGLGLFIVKEIVAAHGGSIEAASSEKGTVFTSRWPKGS